MAIDWQSPDTLAKCGLVFSQMVVFICGAYGWYLIQTWPIVEGNLLRRRLKFKLIHFPYLVGRYSHVMAISMIVSLNSSLGPSSPDACSKLVAIRFNSIMGNIASISATTNLGMRALMIWKSNCLVQCLMYLGFTTHFIFGVTVGSTAASRHWIDENTCIIIPFKTQVPLLTFYVYTILWDMTISALTITGMRRQRLLSATPLTSTLVSQGFGYAMVTCVTGIPMATALALNLNQVMDIFFVLPGCTVSVIASSAFVISLLRMEGAEEIRDTSVVAPTAFAHLTTNINLSEYRSSSEVRVPYDNDTGSKAGDIEMVAFSRQS